MAAVSHAALLATILVLQLYLATSAFVPFVGDVCREINLCGKGKCASSNSSDFGYKCVCDSGWKQSGAEDDESLKFLPCVIPSCSFNNDCLKAPAPARDNSKPNSSVLDPCFWMECGGGRCGKTSVFRSTCVCEDGYSNLFNANNFPCYKQCAFGTDCQSLGINLSNISTPSSPDSNSNSHGVSLIQNTGFVWLNAMVTILTTIMCRYL